MSISSHQIYKGQPARNVAALALAIGAALAGHSLWAQSGEQLSLSGSVELGAEHNSNVSITELESATGEADTAAILDAGFDASWQATDRLTVDAGYSYSGRRYEEFEDFDLDLHLLYTDLSYDFDLFSVGTNYYFADAQLGGDDFLTLKQYSVYAGKLLADQWYLRGALNFSDKSFNNFAQRDADSEGLSLDAFWFFNQGRSTLVFGYAFDNEDARVNAFSYQANTMRIRFTNRFNVIGKDAQLQLGVRVQDRDYRGITPEINARRDDRQYTTEARFEVSLNKYLSVATQFERGAFRSNLASADYTENRVSASLKLAF
jgi:hypothetical protein